MPVNDRYPLADVVALCRQHWERTRRRVFVEYVMLEGVNDSRAQARLLAETLGRDAFKVNLIPDTPRGIGTRGMCWTGRHGTPSQPSRPNSIEHTSPRPFG